MLDSIDILAMAEKDEQLAVVVVELQRMLDSLSPECKKICNW
jgi:hypothetical protein